MDQSIYFYVSILILVSFMPLTVISHRAIRLPKKVEEYGKIMERLTKAGLEDTQTISILDNTYRFWDYFPPTIIISIISYLGFFFLFTDIGDGSILLGWHSGSHSYPRAPLTALLMSFLGAYIWSVQYIFRRLIAIDLPPGAYYNVGARMILSSFVSLVFWYFLDALPTGNTIFNYDLVPDVFLKDMLPATAFLIGFFPQRALHYLAERFKFSSESTGQTASQSLDKLQGMSPYHKVRLAELSIDNIQNLVKASLVELILKTPYKPRQLVDWMLQGWLILYFKDNTEKLRENGVRTILGLKNIGDEDKLGSLANSTGLSIDYLQTVYLIIKDNVSIANLSKAKDCLHVV